MTQTAVLTAVLGVFAENTLAQGIQCQGSRNNWGLSQFRQNSGSSNCWLNWSGWSECAGHCGQAVKTANRKCRGNIPGLGGCQGSELRRKRCSETELVQGKETYCPYWSFWAEWTGCQVQGSTDPCVRNTHGYAKRTRQCHDPYATERGETPKCQGEEIESRVCQGSALISQPRFQVVDDLPAGYQYGDQWSVCSASCGQGKQTCRLVHVCANVPGTWVAQAEWYQSRERACSNSCCQAGEWQLTEDRPQCFAGFRRQVRSWISYTGGINDASPGQDCSALAQSNPNVRRGPGNQYIEEIVEKIPVAFPEQVNSQEFFCNEPQWSTCTPQQSPYGNVLTTCNMNGIRTRTWKHCCSQECETTNQWNQWSTRPVAGSECEVWLQPPYVRVEQETCGPQAEIVTFNNCDVDACNPVCKQRQVCGNEILIETEVPCAADVCGPLAPQQCNMPAPCTCGQEYKTQTCTQQCSPTTALNMQCPPNNIASFSDEQWSETAELVAARNQGLCICKFQAQYMDFKHSWTRETAEDGTICSTNQVNKETRNNAYLQESCLSQEICQMDMCDRQCDLPGQGPQMYTCFRQDACRDPSNNMIPSAPRQCPPKPSCCGWSQWEIQTDCLNNVQCPSDASGMRQLVRREINMLTGQQDENCVKTEVQEEACPRTACPTWPSWSEWSQCSYIVADGTVCGGNRNRARDYMCKNDVAQGNCLPSYGAGRTYSDGNFADQYNQIDAASENHHSSYCYNLYEENRSRATVTTYFNGPQQVDVSQWQWVRDTIDNGCVAGNSTHYREIRNYQISNKCIADQVEVRQEARMVPIQSCVQEVIPEMRLNSCEAGLQSGPCCQYQNNGCAAVVQSMCIATDICAQSRPNMPVQASGVQCPIMDEQMTCEEGPCYQTQNTEDDFCAGECEQTCFMKCGSSFKQKTTCSIAPRWSDWTQFTATEQFDISTGVQLQAIAEDNAIAPITITCNPCGGVLQSTKTLRCAAEDRTEVRSIDCPAPQFAWGEWSQCGQTCANRPSERVCTQVRYLIASAGAEHCQEQQIETRTVDLPDCECGCITRERLCQHQVDASATCGTGQVHERVQYNMCNCVDETQVIGYGHIQVELVQVNGQVEQCDLEFQPRWVAGMQSGCDTQDQICNGGVMTQPRTLRCVEGKAPVGFQEQIQVDQVGICPEAPLVQVVEKQDGCQNECQPSQNMYRECLNGKFEENCECMGYGRQCCQRNPEYQLINNGTVEVRTVSCGMAPTLIQVTIPDPNCECGICGEKICMQNPCTGELLNCVETPSVKGSYKPEIYPLSECQWDIFEIGQDKCNTRGFQVQKCVHACIDNIIQSPPKIDMNRVQIDPLTDASTGFTYDSINGPVTTEYQNIQNCILPSVSEMKSSNCIHTDRCNPYQSINYISICDGVETVTFSSQQACVVQETNEWTPWSACSVECGQGKMTRNMVEGCSGKVLETEEKACGCGIARWSEWSPWVGAFTPCGPVDQAKTSSRTCIEAQSNSYVYTSGDEYVNYLSGGYYRTRINSNIDAECANKCNQCIGEPVRREALAPVEAEIFIAEESCPMNQMDRCQTPYVLKKMIQCDQIVSTQQIACPLPAAPATYQSECSVLCGEGTKTITTQASICEAPVTTTVPCQGRLGKIVEKAATSWSVCSASCGGGQQTSYASVVCELNDENNQVVEIRRRIAKQQCAMHPCAYWGGWSQWSMCSSTCGSGQRQRSRKCEGGPPGTGGCTGDAEYYEVNGQMQAFTPSANGAVHTIPCDDGPCCDFEWSGWSNCCIDGSAQRRLRWKGNSCTGEWRKEDETCDEGTNQETTIQQCNAVYNIQQSYFTGYEQDTIEITDIRVVGGRNSYTGQNVYYGRRIDDGMYTIGGQTYVLRNSGDSQVWYVLNADNTQTKIEVEMFESKTTYSGSTFYYRFGASSWYKYINNRFVYSATPPAFYTGSQTASFQPLQTITSYNSGMSASSASSSSSVAMVNHASTSSYFNQPTQYITAQSSSSGSSQQSSYQFFRPVATEQVTITETSPVAAVQPVAQMMAHTSNNSKMVKSEPVAVLDSAPNSDSMLFGGW